MEKAINVIHIILGASNGKLKKMYAMMVPPIPVTPALTSAKMLEDISPNAFLRASVKREATVEQIAKRNKKVIMS